MAGQSQFINVMKGPSGALSFNITITAKNNPTPLNLVVPIVFTQSMDEKTAAQFICDALNTAFFNTGIYYGDVPTGTPQFEMTSGYYTVMPRAWSCDHYVNVWSQAQYLLTIGPITQATPGTAPGSTIIQISEGPIYVTLAEATRMEKIFQINFSQFVSDDMGRVLMLRIASDELRSMAGFAISAAQYLYENKCAEECGWHLSYPPIIAFDNVAFGGPSIATIIYSVAGIRSRGTLDLDTGHIDLGVEKAGMFQGMALKISYVAGFPTIDSLLKDETMRLVKLNTQPERIIEMAGGSGRVKFESVSKVRDEIRKRLRQLLGRR